MVNVRLAGGHLYGNCCSSGVAGNGFDGVISSVVYPRDVLDEICDLIESVFEGLFCSDIPVVLFYSLGVSGYHNRLFLSNPHLCLIINLIRDLFFLSFH